MSVAHEVLPPAIDATGVTRRFGTNWVLRGVTLRVDAGEVVGLLGANGSGKSTLLRICATLLRPHHGEVRIAGHDVQREPHDVRSRIGYLAHTAGLYQDLTARENLAFACTMLAREPREADVALDRVGLTEVAERRVRDLSAGMQRRLALARLILVRPRVLLLDEPYGNLDVDGIALMNELINAWADDGVAALVVLHELAPALEIIDRTVTIAGGRIAPAVSLASATDFRASLSVRR